MRKICKFLQVVPDAISGPKEWFDYHGRWSDGSKFHDPEPQKKSSAAALGVIVAGLAVLAAFALKQRQ